MEVAREGVFDFGVMTPATEGALEKALRPQTWSGKTRVNRLFVPYIRGVICRPLVGCFNLGTIMLDYHQSSFNCEDKIGELLWEPHGPQFSVTHKKWPNIVTGFKSSDNDSILDLDVAERGKHNCAVT